jgi:SOS response regulatory protein OraA/RecX
MDYPAARKYAFRLLSMRNYHSGALLRKLAMKGFPEEICEKVLEDCKRLGFIQDDEVILSYLRRGYGPRYIQYKLQLSSAEVRRIISRGMQKERVLSLSKKWPREKAIRTLERKGFDLDIVIEVFSTRRVE